LLRVHAQLVFQSSSADPRVLKIEFAVEAATKALLDAGINYDEIEQAHVGYCYGDSTCGQRALYALGLTGIPILNVNNK
jgi:sterol carrier protein 2